MATHKPGGVSRRHEAQGLCRSHPHSALGIQKTFSDPGSRDPTPAPPASAPARPWQPPGPVLATPPRAHHSAGAAAADRARHRRAHGPQVPGTPTWRWRRRGCGLQWGAPLSGRTPPGAPLAALGARQVPCAAVLPGSGHPHRHVNETNLARHVVKCQLELVQAVDNRVRHQKVRPCGRPVRMTFCITL